MIDEKYIPLVGVFLTFLINLGLMLIAWRRMQFDVNAKYEDFLNKQTEEKKKEENAQKERDLEEKKLNLDQPTRKANTDNVISKTMESALDSLQKVIDTKDKAHEKERTQLRDEMAAQAKRLEEQDKRHEIERDHQRLEIANLRNELIERDRKYNAEQIERDRKHSNEIASLKSQIVEYVNGVDILIEQVSKYEVPKYVRRKTGPLSTAS
jgi:hypothetical protein